MAHSMPSMADARPLFYEKTQKKPSRSAFRVGVKNARIKNTLKIDGKSVNVSDETNTEKRDDCEATRATRWLEIISYNSTIIEKNCKIHDCLVIKCALVHFTCIFYAIINVMLPE